MGRLVHAAMLLHDMDVAAGRNLNEYGAGRGLPPIAWSANDLLYHGRRRLAGQVVPALYQGQAHEVAERWARSVGLRESDRQPGGRLWGGYDDGFEVELWVPDPEDASDGR